VEKEKNKFHYVEPSVDHSAKSLASREEVVGRPTLQEHDGTPFPGNDDSNFKPVQLATVNVYDPDADVFEKDYA
jgi:hypothetical protein